MDVCFRRAGGQRCVSPIRRLAGRHRCLAPIHCPAHHALSPKVHAMSSAFRFTYEKDWRTAPVAFWVHVPVPGSDVLCDPPVPPAIPHKGYAVLRVEFERHELQFSAPAQLDHFIEVISTKPLPTSKQLASRRGLAVGPNGHWLSRLPAELKLPRKREKLVQFLQSVRAKVVDHRFPGSTFVAN